MKYRSWMFCCAGLAAVGLMAGQAAQPDKKAPRKDQPAKQEQPKKADPTHDHSGHDHTGHDHAGHDHAQPGEGEGMDFSQMPAFQPGAGHQVLEPMIGEFDAVVKFWMDPAAPPGESKGVMKNAWVMGGRFLRGDFSGDMMGTPFTGVMTLGYNNVANRYESTWIDSIGTGIIMNTGKADEAGKVITMTGDHFDPMTGAEMKSKDITRIVDNNTHVYEMYMVMPDGADMKHMEITYTRRGANK